jgi:hypothetical protein
MSGGSAGPAQGHLIIGLTPDETEVVLNVPTTPGNSTLWEHVIFSPEQAESIGKLFLAKAKQCRRADRTFEQPIEHHGSARTPLYTCLTHEYHGSVPCPTCKFAPGVRRA